MGKNLSLGECFAPRSRASRRARFAVIGLSASIAFAGCASSGPYNDTECVNIATGLILTDTGLNDAWEMRWGFTGKDAQGFTRTVSKQQAEGWKCRRVWREGAHG